MPLWLWVGLATMFVSALHIIIDFGVARFDLHGTLSATEASTLVGVALIQVWWAISFMAGARGNGSGVASAGILGAGWAALTNGFPIVYCPPVCEEARPLTDLGHVGSIVFGILLVFASDTTVPTTKAAATAGMDQPGRTRARHSDQMATNACRVSLPSLSAAATLTSSNS